MVPIRRMGEVPFSSSQGVLTTPSVNVKQQQQQQQKLGKTRFKFDTKNLFSDSFSFQKLVKQFRFTQTLIKQRQKSFTHQVS